MLNFCYEQEEKNDIHEISSEGLGLDYDALSFICY